MHARTSARTEAIIRAHRYVRPVVVPVVRDIRGFAALPNGRKRSIPNAD